MSDEMLAPENVALLIDRAEARALAREPAVGRLPALDRRRMVAEAVLRRLRHRRDRVLA
jgi:hypothetical protein